MHTNVIALVGVLTPLLVAFVTNSKSSTHVKGVIAMAVSVAIGVATAYAGGLLSPADVLGSILAAYGAAQAAYTALFKPLGVTSWILDNLGSRAAEGVEA
jgi:hypothetical protein